MESSPFWKLPRELRDTIWELAVPQDEPIALRCVEDHIVRDGPEPQAIGLLTCCKAVHLETIDLFHALNTFVIDSSIWLREEALTTETVVTRRELPNLIISASNYGSSPESTRDDFKSMCRYISSLPAAVNIEAWIHLDHEVGVFKFKATDRSLIAKGMNAMIMALVQEVDRVGEGNADYYLKQVVTSLRICAGYLIDPLWNVED